jgi:hypothetical protein
VVAVNAPDISRGTCLHGGQFSRTIANEPGRAAGRTTHPGFRLALQPSPCRFVGGWRRRAADRFVSTCSPEPGQAARLHMIDRAGDARRLRAVRAAEERPPGLDTVADDVAAAVIADRRELVDGTLEAVEHMSLAGRDDFE